MSVNVRVRVRAQLEAVRAHPVRGVERGSVTREAELLQRTARRAALAEVVLTREEHRARPEPLVHQPRRVQRVEAAQRVAQRRAHELAALARRLDRRARPLPLAVRLAALDLGEPAAEGGRQLRGQRHAHLLAAPWEDVQHERRAALVLLDEPAQHPRDPARLRVAGALDAAVRGELVERQRFGQARAAPLARRQAGLEPLQLPRLERLKLGLERVELRLERTVAADAVAGRQGRLEPFAHVRARLLGPRRLVARRIGLDQHPRAGHVAPCELAVEEADLDPSRGHARERATAQHRVGIC